MAVVIGIDPGSQYTGWGIVQSGTSRSEKIREANQYSSLNQNFSCIDFGTITLSTKQPIEERLAKIYTDLDAILLLNRVECLVLEKVFLGKNFDSSFKLGQVRGVILALAGKHKVKVHEYATRKIKKVITGNGNAEKSHVQFVVNQMMKIQVKEFDASDALALAIGHVIQDEVTNRFRDSIKLAEY